MDKIQKIQKMIEAYNKKANKWGFDKIEVTLNTEFKEKTTIGYSFFGRIKVLYQNGYMKEYYKKIKNSLPPIKVEEPKPIEKKVEIKHDISIEEQAFANTFKG